MASETPALSKSNDSYSVDATDEDEFLQEARVKYQYDRDIDAEDRELAEKDALFASGGEHQWNEREIKIRKALKRPILTWNRIHSFCQQVQNDGRQNNPAIMISRDDKGTKEDAEVLAGRIRQIEYESNASNVYSHTRDQQIVCGRGFYRVVTQYKSPTSNKQVIRLKPITNQFSVTCDGNAFAYDRSDAEHWFIETIMSRSSYTRKYGKRTKLARHDFYSGLDSSDYSDWFTCGRDKQCVRVCEYWVKEYYDRNLCTLLNGSTVWEDEKPRDAAILKTEKRQDFKIIQYIIDGVGILDKTEWLGCYFPIVPQWGRVEIVEGKLRHVSLPRYSHDAQRLVNLYVSNIAEQVGMMPKTPYVGFKGQFEGLEKVWADINEVPRAYMEVNPVVHNGVLLPPPTRVQSEPPIQALTIGLGQAIDALKASMNIYDASLGAGPIDASGLALQRRNTESDVANFHFSDNETWSRKYLGQVLIDLIQKIEVKNTESLTVRDQRGRTSQVVLNKSYQNAAGETVIHKLDEGEFMPHVSSGPSYTSARQQAATALGEIAQRDPNFMNNIGGDVYMRALDFEGADELADRYERRLPPEVLAKGDPNQAQAKLAASMAQNKQLADQVQALTEIINQKKIEQAGKMQIVRMQEDTKEKNLVLQATIAEANLQGSANTARLNAETAAIAHGIDTAHAKDAQDWDTILAHLEGLAKTQDEEAAEAEQAGAQ